MIDCHTHCFPESIQADPRAWAEAQRESHWAELVAPLDRPSIQDWATPQKMLKAMDHAGIDQAVLLGWYWEQETTCNWHNTEIANWVAQAPDRFIGFASIYPNGNVTEQLNHASELGLRGVGELHCGVQKFNAHSDGWLALAEFCSKHQWPVNLHVTEAAGKNPPHSVPTPLQSICDLAASAPHLKIILAHWGGGLPLLESNPHLQSILKNVYYDCAASPLLYDPAIFRRVIECVGVDKILYGSDYPLRVFPRAQKEAEFNSFLDQIRVHANLSETEFNALTRETFKSLFQLNC